MPVDDDTCGAANPSLDGVICAKAPHLYGHHVSRDGAVWPGAPVPSKDRGKRLEEIRSRIKEPKTVRAPQTDSGTWVAPLVAWDREAWLEQARGALLSVCQENDRFTNEQVWALTPDCPTRKYMRQVTVYGVRQGWMERTKEGVMVDEPWVTSDGVEFPMNKIVPVYASLIRP